MIDRHDRSAGGRKTADTNPSMITVRVRVFMLAPHEESDTGKIRNFTINHNGQVYSSSDPPVQLNDLQTAYAYIRPTSSTCTAHIDIQHTWRGDLVVRLGVGDPSNPLWERTVSNRQGEDEDDLVVDVDVCAAEAYLPPSENHPWFYPLRADGI